MIVGGCVVLVAVLRFFDLPGCLVSESDILDGLAATLRAADDDRRASRPGCLP